MLQSQGTGTAFEEERNFLVEKYKAKIGFETVALGVHNALAKAVELRIKSISFATMGFGIMGDLSMTESLAAMLTGVATFKDPPDSNLEVQVVIFAQDNPKNRKWLMSNLLPVIEGGRFLDMAQENSLGLTRNVDLVALRNSFLKNDLPTLAAKKQSVFSRATNFCSAWLRSLLD